MVDQDCVLSALRVEGNELPHPYTWLWTCPYPGISLLYLSSAKGPLQHAIQCQCHELIPLPNPTLGGKLPPPWYPAS